MKLTMGKDRKLRDEHGVVVGTVVTLEVELESSGADGGPGVVVQEEQTLELLSPDVGGRAGAGNSGHLDPVREVWDHYVAVMKPRHAGLDPQQRAIIRDALKVATLSECKRAIDGNGASEFHQGRNDRKKKYNALSQILKAKRGGRTTREQIDFFIDLAEKAGLPSAGIPSEDSAKISQAKRDVLDGADFPGDQHVLDRAWEAENYLRGVGILFDSANRRFLTPGDDA